jgi:DNA-binding XRE family transcriptional regulator
MPTNVLTMTGLKAWLKVKPLTGPELATITGIDLKRYRMLDSKNEKLAEEPWLWEAVAISRALCLPGIVTLLTSGNLTDLDLGADVRDDLDVWRTGVKLPLATACRLALRFDFDDPIHIWDIAMAEPGNRQRMQMLASGERTGGTCPWCNLHLVGDAGHAPTCRMILWGERTAPLSTIGSPPKPRRPGKRRLGDSNKAPGLKATRERLGYTQAQIAVSIGMDANYYARIERCLDPLTSEKAELICGIYKVQLHDLFTA